MNDLVTWIREQIADDQSYSEDRDASGHCDWHEGIHLVNAEVQARCEAYLAILAEHPKGTQFYPDETSEGDMIEVPEWYCVRCVDTTKSIHAVLVGDAEVSHQAWPCTTWRSVALAYQHRPGYQEAWRP